MKETKDAPFKVISLNNGKLVLEYDLVAPSVDNISSSGDNYIIGKAYGVLKLAGKALTINGTKIKIQTFIRVATNQKKKDETAEVTLTPPPVIPPTPKGEGNA